MQAILAWMGVSRCQSVGSTAENDAALWAVALSHGSACEGSLQWQVLARCATEAEAEQYRQDFCPNNPGVVVMPLALLR